MKAGCHNYVEVRILSFWEARNVKHKGELMGLTCSSLTQSLISLLYLLLFFTVKWGYVRSVGGDGNDGVRTTRQISHVSSFVPQGSLHHPNQTIGPSNNLLLGHVCTLISRVWLPTTLNHYSMEPLLAIVSERRNVAVPSTFYRRRNIPNICQEIELAELWTNP
ncbi:hypothetical protein Bca52824_089743 [Brassica carinata]|uniref:Uncharacterized protein n=1 Tax=Brassica carinata TaxID=52824 RepID=A0A8X7PF29_BRACI|nr:hypothetical protein Bca52824_089743 [Brassica carinata]